MRLSPQELWSFAQRAQTGLLKPDISPSRTVLRRIAQRHVLRGVACRHLNVQTAPADCASDTTPPFLRGSVIPPTGRKSPQPVANRSNGPRILPTSCPGCGALTQESNAGEAGFYTRSRKAVKGFLRPIKTETGDYIPKHDNVQILSSDLASGIAVIESTAEVVTSRDPAAMVTPAVTQEFTPLLPVCDRCHDLLYNARGVSIAHPSIDSLADSIAESPFRQNHIYHVLDAADFPLSLIPSIYNRLSIAKPRTQNRRSQHTFSKRPTISFVITRSDLLGPTKLMVDSLMPYFTSVLRTALGKSAQDMRLGNVHLVSSKRGWWTRDIKESIWKRGGGNWMVGKVNVGKSNLFEVLFPKGSGDRAASYADLEQEVQREQTATSSLSHLESAGSDVQLLSETSLLPPPQPESAFPALPLVSSLPGTTASPIRLPFGNHKGELIDLPGLARGNIETYVQPEHKVDLVMTHRPTVTQHNIRPGQSLLLGGGLVRITPNFDGAERDATMLAYPFVPISAHVTATEKAVGTQLQQRESGIKSILADAAGDSMTSAGLFTLETDVTKTRAGPLVRAGVRVEQLPFRVFATDVLIEGVGWVELVCQVRRTRQQPSYSGDAPNESRDSYGLSQEDGPQRRFDDGFPRPVVEIFTPEGKHVGQRKCMGAWTLINEGRNTKRIRKAVNAARPRRSMKGAKKQEKALRREASVAP